MFAMKKIVSLSVIAGLLLSLLFSISTARVSGRHTDTGEVFDLQHWDAVSLYVSQLGLGSYLLNLLPAFIAFSVITGISLFTVMRKKKHGKAA